MLNRSVPEQNGDVYKGFYKAQITKVTPNGDTCFAVLHAPKDDIAYAVLNLEETQGAQLLRNKGGGEFIPGENITILRMKKLGDSFTALEIA